MIYRAVPQEAWGGGGEGWEWPRQKGNIQHCHRIEEPLSHSSFELQTNKIQTLALAGILRSPLSGRRALLLAQGAPPPRFGDLPPLFAASRNGSPRSSAAEGAPRLLLPLTARNDNTLQAVPSSKTLNAFWFSLVVRLQPGKEG